MYNELRTELLQMHQKNQLLEKQKQDLTLKIMDLQEINIDLCQRLKKYETNGNKLQQLRERYQPQDENKEEKIKQLYTELDNLQKLNQKKQSEMMVRPRIQSEHKQILNESKIYKQYLNQRF
ncbi:hypothetical protein pb186bvf_014622 [Paramecium bursaria]